jgi:hypothetical protein
LQPEPGRSQEQQVATDDPADSEDDDEDETEHFGVRGLESRFLAPVRRIVSRFWQVPLAASRSPAQPRGLRALLTRFLMPSRFMRRPVASSPPPILPPERPQPKRLKSRFEKSAGPKM